MEPTIKNKSIVQPKTMAELLPGLSGILSKDSIQTLTAKKAPRSTMAQTRTAEKNLKPLTIAEMRADLLSLKVKSPRTFAQPTTSVKKRNWNSSIKVENKTKSCTGDGQLNKHSVRKVLNFQTKAPALPRQTMIAPETPKYPKPEFRAKKSVNCKGKNTRMSGICNLQETPIITNKNKDRRMTHNKENTLYKSNLKKNNVTPKSLKQSKLHKHHKPVTPLANISFKSNSDSSFLLKEKEINDIEEKALELTEEQTLENIPEVSPPISTPFKEYRSVQDFFNNSNASDNSDMCNDDTIMCFDNLSIPKDNKREESVIVSLCDLLNKASVTNNEKKTDNKNTELDDLLVFETQTENNIKMIDNGIKTLMGIKESQLRSLKYVKKLIKEKLKDSKNINTNNMDTTLVDIKSGINVEVEENVPVSRPSVIKMKSPSYKIPKKNLCLRKKVFYKSMPNVTNTTPTKETDNRALDMYMQMKEKMNFLNTPVVKHSNFIEPDTPAITSHNLQKQLDKLFNCS